MLILKELSLTPADCGTLAGREVPIDSGGFRRPRSSGIGSARRPLLGGGSGAGWAFSHLVGAEKPKRKQGEVK